MRAMKAPVFAAFAPGVLVVGRMVSAISSRYATSCGVKSWNAVFAPVFAVSDAERAPRSQAVSSPVPPTNATPPSSALTRRIASRRVSSPSSAVSSGVIPSVLIRFDMVAGSEVLALELVHGEVGRAGGERHVGERRVHG